MSEDLYSKEVENTPELTHLSLEQGEVLVRRVYECLKQNPQADLYILIDLGAVPLETVIRELNSDLNVNIEHLRMTRSFAQELIRDFGTKWKRTILSLSEKDLQQKIGVANFEFLRKMVKKKEHIILIDDIEFEGQTLDLTEVLIRTINPKSKIVRFPIIKSSQDVSPDDDGWPFALFDDTGMVKGYEMPWGENQARYIDRVVDPDVSMRTIPMTNPDSLAISLRQDLQKITRYFNREN